jgi:sugar O-acyltransferase (sialic acid O-acetyltransferase NeuD family)
MPAVSVNEESSVLVEWRKSQGDHVRRGDVLCIVETTKATYDVEAEGEGYLACIGEPGKTLAAGEVIAVLTSTPGEDYAKLLPAGDAPHTGRRWTKKAAITAKRLGVEIEELAAQQPGRILGEADVIAAGREDSSVHDLFDDVCPANRRERVLLLGGGSGGGMITLDAILRGATQRAVGILDNDPKLHGKSVMGVSVLGPTDMALELWQKHFCDSMIICITADSQARTAMFETLVRQGVRFANVLDPSAVVRANVSLGQGNLIMAACFLASGVVLGDNNFLASHTCIEHHTRVSSQCTFGPRCTTSGRVTIGDHVKLGMGVLIEPYVSIGSNSVVASGAVVTTDIPPNSLVKIHQKSVVRPRE